MGEYSPTGMSAERAIEIVTWAALRYLCVRAGFPKQGEPEKFTVNEHDEAIRVRGERLKPARSE